MVKDIRNSIQSFWEVNESGISINSELYQKVKKELEVKHYNKLNWNHPIILKVIKMNPNYSTRKVITMLEMYYWKFDTYEQFINNIKDKTNNEVFDIYQII